MSHGVTGLGERITKLHQRSAEAEQQAVLASDQAHAELLRRLEDIESQEAQDERSEEASPKP